MTQMIYRPQTAERITQDQKTVHKTVFRGVPCDALIVEPEHVADYTGKGWFDDPNKMIYEPAEQPKPRRGKKAHDRSDQDSQ